MLFKKQPLFCPNCGKAYEGEPRGYLSGHLPTCSKKCDSEIRWKYTLYVRGKDYYPEPVDLEISTIDSFD